MTPRESSAAGSKDGIESLMDARPLVAELREEAASFEGTAGQYLADMLNRAADALGEAYEAGKREAFGKS